MIWSKFLSKITRLPPLIHVGKLSVACSQDRGIPLLRSDADFIFTDICVQVDGNTLLDNVSGSVKPGELLAIMGPSGAGKTTLLNTLNGRMPYTGSITVGDTPLCKSLKRKMCYVLQHELFFPNLTLQETIQFAAIIRLPDELPRSEKMRIVDEVVEALDLTSCMDTVMGGMNTPGLSGGEKKRANIACEILCDPDIIFLDEPTTGLDSSSAASLISQLKTYAVSSQKTVLSSIHQPSSAIFFQFDKLLLLHGGQMAYFGLSRGVVDHFHACGVEIDSNYNPADFILEALSESKEIRAKLLMSSNGRKSSVTEGFQNAVVNQSTKPGLLSRLKGRFTKKKEDLTESQDEKYSDLDPGSVHMSLLDLTEQYDHVTENFDSYVTEPKWPTGFWTQYSQLTLRTFRESRARIFNRAKIIENLLVCAFVCLIFFQIPRTEDTLRDRMGAVFFISAHWGFVPLFDAVTSFPMERPVINKERLAGWYRLSAYYAAKMTSELFLALVQPAVFIIISYWVIGLNGISSFFATLGTIFINSLAGQSFGLFVGIACLHINQAMTAAITLQMAIMLLGGLFTRNIPLWLDWMKYLSFLHYTFHSLMVLEFSDSKPVQCLLPANSSSFSICQRGNVTTIPGETVLEFYDIRWSYWQYVMCLMVFIVIFRALGYLMLRYVRKPL